MKIAVSSQGTTLDSPLDPRFGRAAGFIVHDLDSGETTYQNNDQNMSLAQGAGIQAAMTVAGTGADAVITGHVGPKAFLALAKGSIQVYLLANQSTVAQAIEAFKQGRLELAQGPDKEGHWA